MTRGVGANGRAWELCRSEPEISVGAVAEEIGATIATVRKHAQIWHLTGLATLTGRGADALIMLTDRSAPPPMITWDGRYAGVSPSPSADHYWTVNFWEKPPAVARHERPGFAKQEEETMGIPTQDAAVGERRIEVPAPPAPANGATAQIEEAAGAHEADRLYGDGAPYDRERLTAEVRHHLGQGVLAMLEAGKRLILLKEHETHGAWLPLLERIGISRFVAESMMRAARKFLDGPNAGLVTHLDSATKVYELALMDDEDLEELREGGTIANGLGLDDVQRMSPTELRQALRAERAERAEREQAQRDRLAAKDGRIGDLEDSVSHQAGIIRRLRQPDRMDWADAETALAVEIANLDRQAHTLCTNLRSACRRAQEIQQDQSDDEAPQYMRAATVHLWRELQGVVSVLGSHLDELEHLVSVPLPRDDGE